MIYLYTNFNILSKLMPHRNNKDKDKRLGSILMTPKKYIRNRPERKYILNRLLTSNKKHWGFSSLLADLRDPSKCPSLPSGSLRSSEQWHLGNFSIPFYHCSCYFCFLFCHSIQWNFSQGTMI